MPKYTSPTQIKDRCVASGHSRSVIHDFKLNRTAFRERARAGQIPGVKKASCIYVGGLYVYWNNKKNFASTTDPCTQINILETRLFKVEEN
ncbi:hypothetical protein QCA50_016791 [Cerrena zonata]|uniref:Uncharacterized protein n=1 Tax=Cerrena zonata TaxID=2478898 RepID=A0AAW0FH14_9APHY